MAGLDPPIVVEIHWYRQLRLVETDNVTFIIVDELSNDMVFLLTVEASNVEAHHCQFLEFFHFIIFSPRSIVLPVSMVVASSRRGVRFLVSPTVLLSHGARLLMLARGVRFPLSTVLLLGRGVRVLLSVALLLLWWVRLLLSTMLLLVWGIDSLHFSVTIISCTCVVDAIVIFSTRLVVLSCTILFRLSFLFLAEQVSLCDFLLFSW